MSLRLEREIDDEEEEEVDEVEALEVVRVLPSEVGDGRDSIVRWRSIVRMVMD